MLTHMTFDLLFFNDNTLRMMAEYSNTELYCNYFFQNNWTIRILSTTEILNHPLYNYAYLTGWHVEVLASRVRCVHEDIRYILSQFYGW